MLDRAALKAWFAERCVFGAPAADFTTYRAGGRAEALVSPATPEELRRLCAWCRAASVPFLVLGRGSNVLVSDRGLPGVTALTERLCGLEVKGNAVSAQAGAAWDDLVRLSSEAGLSGLEKTSGIPGSVGGAVRMNAGAFGQEACERLVSVEAFDGAGRTVTLSRKDIRFGYRQAGGLEDLIIVSARFEFPAGAAASLFAERAAVLAARAAKQPLDLPSAGSVFRRPPGDYASRLIDAAGLKGLRIGGAEVSPKHAGFIVNSGGATAADIHALIREVQRLVREKTGVELRLEQILLGEF